MVSITALWLPILLSAVGTFIISSIVHMVFQSHNGDFKKLADEDKFSDAMRAFNIPPGDYMFPHCSDNKSRATEEYAAKLNAGPIGFMTIFPNGPFTMGKSLSLWFVYSLVIGAMVAMVASVTIPAGAGFGFVAKVTGVMAFMAYGIGGIQNSIWYNRDWATTVRYLIDSAFYAASAGALFAWLWPSGV
jgi:hypothetical protein